MLVIDRWGAGQDDCSRQYLTNSRQKILANPGIGSPCIRTSTDAVALHFFVKRVPAYTQ